MMRYDRHPLVQDETDQLRPPKSSQTLIVPKGKN